MDYRKLGNSELLVSAISFGCMSLQADSLKATVLQQAVDAGINFFDTADLYEKGMNEELVGKALQIVRSKILIASKTGNVWRPDGTGWDWKPSKSHILASADSTLGRLGTDYLDLYQLHGGTIDDPIDEIIEAFERLKEQGKIRTYGISSIRPNVVREYVKRSNISSVMLQYSLLDRRPEESILPLLAEHNIGILCRGSLAQGLLIDKPAKEYLEHSKEEVHQAAELVRSLSMANRMQTQTCLQYVLSNPAITSAVVGIRTAGQLQQAIATSEAALLTNAELQKLKTLIPVNKYTQHR